MFEIFMLFTTGMILLHQRDLKNRIDELQSQVDALITLDQERG